MHIAGILEYFLIMLSICVGIKRFGKQQLAFRSKVASIDAMRLFSVQNIDSPTDFTRNFVTNIIENDLAKGVNGGRVVTRFPPEPNGYLHLGHAKSINFNFAVAKAYNGVTHMRFDDTNPTKEDVEYVNSILQDVKWLVTGEINPPKDPWYGPVRHASDYFSALYDCAEYLIKQGLAYVDHLSPEEMKEYRGTLTEAGRDSPYRSRTIQENLQLFQDMKNGKFPDGHCVLRARIDMANSNLNLRDPTLYRIKHEKHHLTNSMWSIYPMYDFAHAVSDALEGITHSLCTLEFDNHRPLYDWIIDQLLPSGILPSFTIEQQEQEQLNRPYQYEFSRLNLQYTVLSKRKLITLIQNNHVQGWNDPRLPTITGLRRRGIPSSAIKLFCNRIGISKVENNIDIKVLEECSREVLDQEAPRLFAIAKPLKVTITNWDRSLPEIFSVPRHPKRSEMGFRELPFTKTIYIDKDDFFDTKADINEPNLVIKPPKGYKRLLYEKQVRLKNAYVITCNKVIRNDQNEVCELLCTYDALTRAGHTPIGSNKVKGIIQWISQEHAVKVDLYQYDRLFLHPSPGKNSEDGDFIRDLNPHSLEVIHGAVVEANVVNELQTITSSNNTTTVIALNDSDSVSSTSTNSTQVGLAPGTFQFERMGYFALDSPDPGVMGSLNPTQPLKFNRIVTLKDTWQNHYNSSDITTIETAPTTTTTIATESDK